MITLKQMYTRIITNAGRPDKAALAQECINDVLLEITNEGTYKWMLREGELLLFDGIKSYDILTTNDSEFYNWKLTSRMRQITQEPESEIYFIPPEVYDSTYTYPEGDSEGTPYNFTVKQGEWSFYPIPDQDYTVKVLYYALHDTLNDDEDTFTVGEDWEPLIEDLAYVRFCRKLQMFQAAAAYSQVTPSLSDRKKILQARDKITLQPVQLRSFGGKKSTYTGSTPWASPFCMSTRRN